MLIAIKLSSNLVVFRHKLHSFCYHVCRTKEQGRTLVKLGNVQFHNTFKAIGGNTPGLLNDKSQWIAFI